MAEQIEQAARTAGRTFNISLAELAGANAGQRNDLLALNQAVYRVPDGTLYTSTGSQLVLAQGLPVTASTNPLTGGIELSAGGVPLVVSGGGVSGLVVGSPAAAAANTLAIQAALDLRGTVSINTSGIIFINATLRVDSNTTVQVGRGVTLKLIDGSGRCNIFINKNTQTGDTNISIVGSGALDCNYQNIGATQSDSRLMGVRMTNVTRSLVEGLSIINCLKYAVHITKCTDFTVRDITVNTQSVGGDGVHVHGNSNIGLIENIKGQTGDDVIALNVHDVSNWRDETTPSFSIGPITNVTIRNITANCYFAQSGSCVAVYSNVTGVTTPVTNVAWANGIGTFTCAGFTAEPNKFVQVTGVAPAAWNGNFRVLTASAGTFTVQLDYNPGAFVSAGAVDASYEMSGITIEDIRPGITNSGHVINLTTFASPAAGGTINDIVIRNVRPTSMGANAARIIQVGTSIAKLSASEIRHISASGVNKEMLYVELGKMGETWVLSDFSNELPFTGTLGALIKFMSPVKNLAVDNFNLSIADSGTSALYLNNGASSTAWPFDSVEISNYTCTARQNSVGNSALELGGGIFPCVNISNIRVSNLVSAIRNNGNTGNANININGAQAKNLAGGSSFIVLYSTAVTQISVFGYTPGTNVFGAYQFLTNATTGGSVTMLKAAGSPNYVYTSNWLSASTPGAGSQLFCDGHEIQVDVSKIARWDGAIVRNTNAALGTLAAAGLVSCQGTAANSWSLMSDPTKKY